MENYVERGKAFLNSRGSRLALKVAPLALVAAAVAHATPNFNAPSFTSNSFNCSGGALSGAQPIGVVANNGHGIVLSGALTLSTGPGSNFGTCVDMNWAGTGSGTFDSSTLPVLWNFIITPSASGQVTVTGWSLAFTINEGTRIFTCSSNCSGTTPTTVQSIAVTAGQTLANYQVYLRVNLTWNTTVASSLTLNVPPDSSIHINAPIGGGGTPVPAVSTVMLAAITLGLLALGSAYTWRPKINPLL